MGAFGLLLWKNFTLLKRRPKGVTAQVLLPCAVVGMLILVRSITEDQKKTKCQRDPDSGELIGSPDTQEDCDFNSFNLAELQQILKDTGQADTLFSCNDPSNWTVAYAPSNQYTDAIMDQADIAGMPAVPPALTKGFLAGVVTDLPQFEKLPDEAALEAMFYNLEERCKVGIVFSDWPEAAGGGGGYSYTLRFDSTPGGFVKSDNAVRRKSWLTDKSFSDFTGQGPRGVSPVGDFCGPYAEKISGKPLRNASEACGSLPGQSAFECFGCLFQSFQMSIGTDSPGYVRYQYLSFESLIDQVIAWHCAKSARVTEAEIVEMLGKMDTLTIERFPYPQYEEDGYLYAIQFGLPLLLMLSYMYSALTIVRNVVHEKERKLKESMKMMGLPNWAHWSAWFVQAATLLFGSNVIMALLIHFGGILTYSDMTLILVYLLLFSFATINFCFLLSTFFKKATSAAVFAAILWYMSYFPYSIISRDYSDSSLQEKTNYCLLSTTCMSLGAYVISGQEGNGVGVTWANAFDAVSVDDDFSFGRVLQMLLLDGLLYFAIAWYVDQVFPGDFGIPRRWYFVFTAAYWCGKKQDLAPADTSNIYEDDHQDDAKFESDPTGLTAGIRLQALRKQFNPKMVAVKGTTLNMYQDQILSLLGHNGAGKTTTMNMITGLFPPSSGTAIVNGYDVFESPREAQSSLGICPQHDVLFDTLTVEEHLQFFCRLKGVPSDEVEGHVTSMIKSLKLPEKRHFQSKALSGGMKRRLSCGMAFVGGSKVVILDEPTSGMDPSARRATWDLITGLKAGRTILLSTHFMDEADLLGDRIAIMSDGVVKCCGSSIFLKRHYGVGYSLIMVTLPGCDASKVLEFVQGHVATATLQSNVGAELNILLPRDTAGSFEALFDALDKSLADLGLDGYGCTVTTLEEVFLKVGEGNANEADEAIAIQDRIESQQKQARKLDLNRASNSDETALLMPNGKPRRLTGAALLKQQFGAMLVKRAINAVRNKGMLAVQLIPPIFFTLLTLALTNQNPAIAKAPLRSSDSLMSNYGAGAQMFIGTAGGVTANTTAADAAMLKRLTGLNPVIEDLQGENNGFKQLLLSRSNGTTYRTFEFNSNTPMAIETAETDYPNLNGETSKCWFNGQAFHSIAECMSLGQNLIFARAVGEENAVTITSSNFPMPMSAQEEAAQISSNDAGLNIANAVLFGTSPMVASFVLFIVAERERKAKHVQFVSGVGAYSYWLSNFLWDVVNYMLPVVGLFILFAAFGTDPYIGERFGVTVTIFVLYAWSIIPLMYCASFMFTTSSIAFVTLTLFNMISGLALMITVFILKLIEPDTATTLNNVFMILPNYCFGSALSSLYEKYTAYSSYQENGLCLGGPCPDDNYYSWEAPGVGQYLFAMFVEGIGFMILLLLAEKRVFTWLRSTMYARWGTGVTATEKPVDVDEDVEAESQLVDSIVNRGVSGSDLLVVDKLSKVYQSSMTAPPKRAVNGLSFAIRPNECFGLLGVNGAGKTTTFKMLTGDETVTSGKAYLKGLDTATEMTEARQYIGYCPQYDALIDVLTGREILTMFARLRGMVPQDIEPAVNELIEFLMLEKHADKQTMTYSGGNKRKLSTAIALIGDPDIIFLDEPTTGMDPGARRFLWNALLRVVGSGRSIVLTSHSMEECEALCNRLGIMVDGRFSCIGPVQHLKQRFGQGYTLIAKLEDTGASTGEVQKYIESNFPGAALKEEHMGIVRYEIMGQTLSRIFGAMERGTAQLGLEDYSVTQATLEQVFLDFAAAGEGDDA